MAGKKRKGPAKKPVTVRLHRQHDMDLINLYRTPGFQFQKVMKRILIAAATGTTYQLAAEPSAPEPGYVPKSVPMHFSLDPSIPEEQKAIALLENTKYGLRNSYLKALLRSSLPYIPLTSFMQGDGLVMKFGGAASLGTISDAGVKDAPDVSNSNNDVKDDIATTTVEDSVPISDPVETKIEQSATTVQEPTNTSPAIYDSNNDAFEFGDTESNTETEESEEDTNSMADAFMLMGQLAH